LNTSGKLFIGTSNSMMPGSKKTFPEAFQKASRLNYYAHFFNSTEINQSFYKTPRLITFHKWEEDVGDQFRFSIKFSKAITHEKNLTIDPVVVSEFMANAAGIYKKKGCLLIQFPGKISLDCYSKVATILSEVNKHDAAASWRKAVEFRNASWYIAETAELLREHGAGMVLHDMRKATMFEDSVNGNFIYIRFHGPSGDYRGSYPDIFLYEKAKLITNWISTGKEVYVYFNNTAGSAFANALTLQTLVTDACA
jgi:uncharacterized protein YecE (DUF72 family)